jgi:hypothetical protein
MLALTLQSEAAARRHALEDSSMHPDGLAAGGVPLVAMGTMMAVSLAMTRWLNLRVKSANRTF